MRGRPAADRPGPDASCCGAGRASVAGGPEPSTATGVEPTPGATGPTGRAPAAPSTSPPPDLGGRPLDERVRLPGGVFRMGTDRPGFPADGEAPARRVRVKPFAIDRCAVTNLRFARFVDETGYVTDAERYGWSFVFGAFVDASARLGRAVPGAPWWRQVFGAHWRRPEGGADVDGRLDHPVVHVSWNDAVAFAEHVGGRLPSEAEWEFAARGGLEGATFPWGDELEPGGEHRCNVFQGVFPTRDDASDGYAGTAPADAFAANGSGLHNTVGNVWEWCADWFGTDHPKGPLDDPRGPASGEARVMKGGSYLCHASYCTRYRVAARTSGTPDDSLGHLGFRVAYDLA